MRILLTGGSGQVGWELRRELSVLGEVLAPARAALDLRSADSIVAAVRVARPDLIVNAGAYTAVDRAESEAALAMKVNGEAPRILAEEAARRGAGMIHFSTDYVFDGSKTTPYLETDEPAPLNQYGRSKLAGEDAVRGAGIPHLIFRTSWVYASRGSNFMLTMLRLARERTEIKVVADQYGAPTPARSIAEATARAITHLSSGTRLDFDRFRELGGLYHLTAGGRTSWFGFASEIFRAHGDKVKVIPLPASDYPLPARRPQNSVLDNRRIRERFGIILADWKRGLELCLAELPSG